MNLSLCCGTDAAFKTGTKQVLTGGLTAFGARSP